MSSASVKVALRETVTEAKRNWKLICILVVLNCISVDLACYIVTVLEPPALARKVWRERDEKGFN